MANILEMNTVEMMHHMAQGNPGAIKVIAELLKRTDDGGEMAIIYLDELEFYGSKLWMAYKDYCKCNIDKLISKLIYKDEDLINYVNYSSKVKKRINND